MLNWFYAPGSRDAPLGYALAEASAGDARIGLYVRIDERDASFMALGAARASGSPVAVVTTSGTAVGNVLPAVMEAHHAQVPLVVVSADRPAELRGSGANQTTTQPGIFREFLRFETDLQPVQPDRILVDQARRAVAASLGRIPLHEFPAESFGQVGEKPAAPTSKDFTVENPAVISVSAGVESDLPNQGKGPVHLNISFAPPLVPLDVSSRYAQKHSADCATEAPSLTGDVLIVGDLPDEDFPGAYALWQKAEACAIPVFAEPTTRWRSHPNAVLAYSRVMDSPALEPSIQRALIIGRPTLTRPITRMMQDSRAEFLDAPGLKISLDNTAHQHWDSAAELATSLAENPDSWLAQWKQRGETLVGNLTSTWGIHQVAHEIWLESGGTDLFLGSSLTIRAFDTVADFHALSQTATAWARRTYANRGLAGIDGILASAWGVALSAQKAVRVVLGDISFFHDLGALVRGRDEPVPNLQVIVLDNGGGQIFAQLEHGEANPETLRRFFLTPQVGDMAGLASAAGWRVEAVGDLQALRTALARPIVGLSLIRVNL